MASRRRPAAVRRAATVIRTAAYGAGVAAFVAEAVANVINVVAIAMVVAAKEVTVALNGIKADCQGPVQAISQTTTIRAMPTAVRRRRLAFSRTGQKRVLEKDTFLRKGGRREGRVPPRLSARTRRVSPPISNGGMGNAGGQAKTAMPLICTPAACPISSIAARIREATAMAPAVVANVDFTPKRGGLLPSSKKAQRGRLIEARSAAEALQQVVQESVAVAAVGIRPFYGRVFSKGGTAIPPAPEARTGEGRGRFF